VGWPIMWSVLPTDRIAEWVVLCGTKQYANPIIWHNCRLPAQEWLRPALPKLKIDIANINIYMLEELESDQAIRTTILNLMVVLYNSGISEIHVGGVMRLLGIPDETAAAHDLERLVLDEDFVKYVDQISETRPPDQALH